MMQIKLILVAVVVTIKLAYELGCCPAIEPIEPDTL